MRAARQGPGGDAGMTDECRAGAEPGAGSGSTVSRLSTKVCLQPLESPCGQATCQEFGGADIEARIGHVLGSEVAAFGGIMAAESNVSQALGSSLLACRPWIGPRE